jgi:hypothetical protein
MRVATGGSPCGQHRVHAPASCHLEAPRGRRAAIRLPPRRLRHLSAAVSGNHLELDMGFRSATRGVQPGETLLYLFALDTTWTVATTGG